jgi:chemotaxis protein CheC
MNLSPVQIDAFTELVNIGIGHAANSLNEIIGTHITLNVPEINIVPLSELNFTDVGLNFESVAAVVQGFKGDYMGSASLLFPSESAVKLVSLLTGELMESPGLDTVRGGTLMEVGNIIINAVIGTISNQLDAHLNFNLPEYQESHFSELLPKFGSIEENGVVIIAKANLEISDQSIIGYVLFIYRVEDVDAMVRKVELLITSGGSDER